MPATSERDVEGTAAHGGWMSRLRRLASLNALLGLSVPRYIGRISYPLYLWHWPAIVIWKACFGFLKTDPLPLWPHSLCVLFISMLLASATFHTVEAGARAWRTKRSLAVIAAAYGMVRTAAAIHGSSRPLPPAAVNESRQAEAVHRTRNAARQKQHTTRPGTRELQPTMDQPYRML